MDRSAGVILVAFTYRFGMLLWDPEAVEVQFQDLKRYEGMPVGPVAWAGLQMQRVAHLYRAESPEPGTIPPLWGGALFRELSDRLRVQNDVATDLARRMGYWPWQPNDITQAAKGKLPPRERSAGGNREGTPTEPTPAEEPKTIIRVERDGKPPQLWESRRVFQWDGVEWTYRELRSKRTCLWCNGSLISGDDCYAPPTMSRYKEVRICVPCARVPTSGFD